MVHPLTYMFQDPTPPPPPPPQAKAETPKVWRKRRRERRRSVAFPSAQQEQERGDPDCRRGHVGQRDSPHSGGHCGDTAAAVAGQQSWARSESI